MTRDERLKKYQEAGAEFVEAARAKAEELFHEVSGAGEATHGRATSTVDDLVGGGKRSTDQLFDAIRREISAQLKSLGVATTADLEDLEQRLTGKAPATKAAARKAPATKAAAPTKAATSKVTPARTAAKRTTAAAQARAASATTTGASTAKKAATKATGTTRKVAKKATSATR